MRLTVAPYGAARGTQAEDEGCRNRGTGPRIDATRYRCGAIARGVETQDRAAIRFQDAAVLVGDEAAIGADVAGKHAHGVEGRPIDRAEAGVGFTDASPPKRS